MPVDGRCLSCTRMCEKSVFSMYGTGYILGDWEGELDLCISRSISASSAGTAV